MRSTPIERWRTRGALVLTVLLLGVPTSGGDSMSEPGQPFVVVLGTVQDAGMPHIGCDRQPCQESREDPTKRRRVSCLGVVTEGHVYLLDATPDLPAQAAELQQWRRPATPPRQPVDGVFLTHAHIGHYLGLAYLGREAAGAKGVPVWGTERMGDFLRTNGPWDLLFRLGNIDYRVLHDAVPLPGGVRVEAVSVPHREEYSDTVGFFVRGPNRTVLYLPDIDSWEEWDRSLESVLEEVDLAYVDGTFYSDAELPGRDLSKIPHPRIETTMSMIESLPEALRSKVRFIHLNHSNPLLLDDRGLPVALEGQRFQL